MRNLITTGFVAVLFASTSVAMAHNTRWAWTESKAEKIVVQDAKIRLQGLMRATLEDELQTSARRYGVLAFAAMDVGDANAALTFSTLAYKFRDALDDVRNGLEIDAADCSGLGAAAQGGRFRHFRCAATSEVLEIPSVELVDVEGGDLPTVVEGQPRLVGPFEARLQVHITGKSAITSRQTESR